LFSPQLNTAPLLSKKRVCCDPKAADVISPRPIRASTLQQKGLQYCQLWLCLKFCLCAP